MFDDGKMVILTPNEYEWILSRHEPGQKLIKLELDDEPRDWYVEPLDPAQWQHRPDVLAHIQRQKHADAHTPAA
jgi:hypothetical protein